MVVVAIGWSGMGSRQLGVVAVVVSGKQLIAASKVTCVFCFFLWLPVQQRTQRTTSVVVLDGLFVRLLLHYWQSFANNAIMIAQIGKPAKRNNKKPD